MRRKVLAALYAGKTTTTFFWFSICSTPVWSRLNYRDLPGNGYHRKYAVLRLIEVYQQGTLPRRDRDRNTGTSQSRIMSAGSYIPTNLSSEPPNWGPRRETITKSKIVSGSVYFFNASQKSGPHLQSMDHFVIQWPQWRTGDGVAGNEELFGQWKSDASWA